MQESTDELPAPIVVKRIETQSSTTTEEGNEVLVQPESQSEPEEEPVPKESSTEPEKTLVDDKTDDAEKKVAETEKENGEEEHSVYFNDKMPSQYPIARVVYIKNLSRPLAVGEFKKFLKMCGGGVDPDRVWFDSIRTHCFAEFSNQKTAQRVRETLNNTRFPAQELQRPLMTTDYIPADKLDEWIKREEEQGPRSLTRWVVHYEKLDTGSISADLVMENNNQPLQKEPKQDEQTNKRQREDDNEESDVSRSPSSEDGRQSHHDRYDSLSRSRSRSQSRSDEEMKDDEEGVYYTKTLPSKAFREASPDAVRDKIRDLDVSELTDIDFKKNLNYSTHGHLACGFYKVKAQRGGRNRDSRPQKRRRRANRDRRRREDENSNRDSKRGKDGGRNAAGSTAVRSSITKQEERS